MMAVQQLPGAEDLIIQIKAKSVLDEHKSRIEDIFQVEISYGLESKVDGNQWVNIKGRHIDRKDAKSYIKALCNPTESVLMDYPQHMEEYLKSPKVHLKLESQSGAVILFTENNKIQILGSDTMTVTLAMSAIEDIIETQSDTPSTPRSPSGALVSQRLDEELRRRMSSGKHNQYDFHDDDLNVQRLNDAVKRTFLSALKDSNDSDDTDGSSSATQQLMLPQQFEQKNHPSGASYSHSNPALPSSPVALLSEIGATNVRSSETVIIPSTSTRSSVSNDSAEPLLPPEVFATPKRIQPSTSNSRMSPLVSNSSTPRNDIYNNTSNGSNSSLSANSTDYQITTSYPGTSSSFPVFNLDQITKIENSYKDKPSEDTLNRGQVLEETPSKIRPVTVTLEAPKPVGSSQTKNAGRRKREESMDTAPDRSRIEHAMDVSPTKEVKSTSQNIGEKSRYPDNDSLKQVYVEELEKQRQKREKEEHKDLLFASGIQDNFSEKEIDRVFKEKGSEMTVDDFLTTLRSNRGAATKQREKDVGAKNKPNKNPKKGATDKNRNFPRAPSETDIKTNPALTPQVLQNADKLGPYMDKLMKDHQKEDFCTIDELKANNFERQKILREAYTKQSADSGSGQDGTDVDNAIMVHDAVVEEVIEVDSDEDLQITGETSETTRRREKKRKHRSKGRKGSPTPSSRENKKQECRSSSSHTAESQVKNKAPYSTNQRQQEFMRNQCGRSPSPRQADTQDATNHFHRGRSRSPWHEVPAGPPPGNQGGREGMYGGNQHQHGYQEGATGGAVNNYGRPLYGQGSAPESRTNLRYIVIDGSNIAMSHGNHRVFSCRGIEIAIRWFLMRGHTQVTAFVPQWRTRMVQNDNTPIRDQHLLDRLSKDGYLVFTPARKIPGKGHIVCYDDRFILDLANQTDGVILSNDNYRDLYEEKREWRKTIETSILMYNFVGDIIMIPEDPLGRDGPHLNEFLRKSTELTGFRNQQPRNYQNPGIGYQQRQQNTNLTWQQNQSLMNQGGNMVGMGAMGGGAGILPTPYGGGALLPTPLMPGQQPQRYIPGLHNPQTQQGKRQAWHAQAGAPNKRTDKETETLREQLKAIFSKDEVDAILRNHPAEKNMEKLSSYILDAQVQ